MVHQALLVESCALPDLYGTSLLWRGDLNFKVFGEAHNVFFKGRPQSSLLNSRFFLERPADQEMPLHDIETQPFSTHW